MVLCNKPIAIVNPSIPRGAPCLVVYKKENSNKNTESMALVRCLLEIKQKLSAASSLDPSRLGK